MAEQLVDTMSCVPILTILGSTCSGKSRLGIELARKFAGEIISADSMQVYKGLDIITAKVTKEEQAMAKHHMIDIIDPLYEFKVSEFKNRAVPIIDNLIENGKSPIIVGGTNYYIESLIWKILIDDPNISNNESDKDEGSSLPKIRRIEKDNLKDLYKKLIQVDPEMADRLHPNDKRKIIRSLEIFERHGIPQSEILKEQRRAGGSGLGGPLRYKNNIIFWLSCDKDVLDNRINKRVDSMMEAGLIQELQDFHERYNKDRMKKNELPDYTKGIFQSIGFKEFHKYLILPEEKKDTVLGQKLLNGAIETLKQVTKRYARRQNKWVKNRLLRRLDRQVPPVYSLDSTNVEQWESEVYGKAVEIVLAVMVGEKPHNPPMSIDINNAKYTDSSNVKRHFCEVCQKTLFTDEQWIAHLHGGRHTRTVKKLKKLEKQDGCGEDDPAKRSTKTGNKHEHTENVLA